MDASSAPPTSTPPTDPVVVGVDGSRTAIEALRWAADHCRRTGLPLHVVTCWQFPAMLPGPYQPPISGEDLEANARQVVDAAITEVLGPEPDIVVTREVLTGTPSLALLDLAADAAMVVVGSRGRGGFAGLLLGSVSQHLTEHAPCPVVVIHRHPDDDEAAA